MGFLAPAVPWLIKGGALLGGYLGGKKAESNAMKRSPEEQLALGGAQNAASGLQSTGTQLTTQGLGSVNHAQSYYGTLLGGNRAQMGLATAAPRASITDTYRGAERGLEHGGVRGAVGDMAKAELSRDKASKISGLTTGVQPQAASALADIGTNLTGQGGQRMGAAGSIYNSLLGQGFSNRKYGREEGEKATDGIGRLLFDILSGASKLGGGQKGMSGIPGGQSGPF
jgi:hypothetical protein